ncbi:short-chain dehydrogenase [Brachybacterium endophyticum]|uniref:Short-chain dehydrogenase n=1 Tax=Brachybacterium endophyticum TaxID=2182385 RepID=A0A2U2RH33_9MICO|nr:SDR family oxidoreductase [Brachybacterium endophyticum]PWH05179.1 short-chain dehydrogenase [Brachybacterium endophyticum]
MSTDLAGRIIIVTGASSGIGEAVARRSAASGATTVLLARREGRLRELSAELEESLALPCDVTDQQAVADAVQAVISRYGRIDVLVNNAGRGLQAPIDHLDVEDLREVLELNLVAPLRMMQLVLPHMRARRSGSIVNIGSGITFQHLPGTGGYAASKAALAQLSGVARAELEGSGITVSTVYPFITATEFSGSLLGSRSDAAQLEAGHAPTPRDPGEVAEAVLEAAVTGVPQIDLVPERFGGSIREDHPAI